MQNKSSLLLLVLIAFSLTSCSVVKGIFNAGMGVGIFLVVAVIVLIVFVASKVTKK
ncbi:hypothetical protein [Flavobacterium sp.]|uniref:hypothetical protein n=1 Tax=Flavobacterium sp. TaxID=239 RepID=UPI0026031583|nr:hypothetical protein [Flavobacterium sp.]